MTTVNSIAAVHALTLNGIEWNLNSNNGGIIDQLRKCCNVMGILFNENEIDRAHDIGKRYLDKEQKKKVRSIRVKFKSWKARAAFFKARPKKICKWKEEIRLNIV